jgi:hypothetical protein
LAVSVVPEIPSYFTGSYYASVSAADFSKPMLSVMNEYSSRKPIASNIRGCVGICKATIRAPALIAHRCESKITWQNFSAPYTPHQMAELNVTGPPSSREVFGTSLTPIFGAMETLDFHMYLTGDEIAKTCAGPVNSTHCYLRSAIAEYEVLLANETVTLLDPANPTFISWANNTAITNQTIDTFGLQDSRGSTGIKTTLSGIANAFSFEYYAVAFTAPPDPKMPGYLNIYEPSPSLFLYQHATNNEQYNKQQACTFAWKDPQPAVMAGLNELMFRVGVYVADNYDHSFLKDRLDSGVQTNYTVTGTLQSPVEVFKSDFAYFVAAAAIQQLTIVLVLSTFWGYWRLGRHVSFSPLEIAKVPSLFPTYYFLC